MITKIITAITALTLYAMAPALYAQESPRGKAPYNLLYFDFGADAFLPRGSSASSRTDVCNGIITVQQSNANIGCAEQFSGVGGGGFAMGVRPIRYLQIDAVGLDILGNFNGFGNRSSTFQCVSGCTGRSTIPIGSISGLVTTGARLALPLFHEHLLISAGGGFAWLNSFEHAKAASNVQATCYSCQSAGGHGPTEIAEVMYFPSRRFGVGFRVRNVQIDSPGLTSDGIFSNSVLGTKYRDKFWLIGGVVSIRGVKRGE